MSLPRRSRRIYTKEEYRIRHSEHVKRFYYKSLGLEGDDILAHKQERLDKKNAKTAIKLKAEARVALMKNIKKLIVEIQNMETDQLDATTAKLKEVKLI